MSIYPLWFQIICFAIFASLASSKILDFLVSIYCRIADFLFDGNGFLSMAMIFIVFLFLHIAIFNHTFYIGDSVQIVDKSENLRLYSNFFDNRFIVLHFYHYLSKIEFASTIKLIDALHILSGAVFAVLSFIIARYLGKSNLQKLAAFSVIAFSAQMLVFNHIEFYCLSFLSHFVVFIFLTRKNRNASGDDRKRGSYLFIVFSILAAVMHPILAWSLIFIPIVYISRKLERNRLTYSLAIVGISLIAVLVIDGFTQITGRENIFLILSDFEYFMSLGHWQNVLNYLLFTTAALPIIFISEKNFRPRTDNWLYLYTGSIVAFFMIVFLDFKFGGGDQDLSAVITLPITLFAASKAGRVESKHLAVFIFSLSILFFIIIGGYGISGKLEHERAMQFSLKQDVPYLADDRYPDIRRLAYLTSMQDKYFMDSTTMEYGIRDAYKSAEKLPRDRNSYMYIASFYKRRENYEMTRNLLTYTFIKAQGGYEVIGNIIDVHREWKNQTAIENSPFMFPKVQKSDADFGKSKEEIMKMIDSVIESLEPEKLKRINQDSEKPMWVIRVDDVPFRIEFYDDNIALISPVSFLPNVKDHSPDILWHIWPINRSREIWPIKFVFFRDVLLLVTRISPESLNRETLLKLMKKMKKIRKENTPIIQDQIDDEVIHIRADKPFVLPAKDNTSNDSLLKE